MKDIILYSSSIQFLTLTEKYLKSYKINIKKTISKFKELKEICTKEKNTLFIIQFRKNEKNKTIEILDYFSKNELNFILIYCDRNFHMNTQYSEINKLYISEKPSLLEFRVFLKDLLNKITLYNENYQIKNDIIKNDYKNVIVIGGSTGGTDAVEHILKTLPKNVPPILVVLHMPPVFTNLYAKRLNDICKMEVREAQNGDKLSSGLVLIAPGGMQMRVKKESNYHFVECKKEGKFNGHEPSVDVLFDSAAKILTPNVVSVILTGMGDDGAKGLLKIRENGGYTIGQDKESCIVYGMPKVAYDIGAVFIQANLKDIPKIIEGKI